jgi:thioredoxin-related protein
MYRQVIGILVLCAFLFSCQSAEPSLSELLAQSKQIQGVERLDSLSLFYFTAPDCPLSEQYVAEMKTYAKAFPSVQQVWVVSTNFYSETEVQRYIQEYRISESVVLDSLSNIAKYLEIQVTPSVVLYDWSLQKIVYKGKIDDKIQALNLRKPKADTLFLEENIKAYLHHQDIPYPNTNAIGCSIEY